MRYSRLGLHYHNVTPRIKKTQLKKEKKIDWINALLFIALGIVLIMFFWGMFS